MSDSESNHSGSESDENGFEVKDIPIWKFIYNETFESMKEKLYQYGAKGEFGEARRKFEDQFLLNCKTWLNKIQRFVNYDKMYQLIADAQDKLSDHIEDENECLFVAIDQRRYKLFGLINFDAFKAKLTEQPMFESESETDSPEERETQNLYNVS